MISEKMKAMVEKSSAIRAMFEEGNRLAEIYGKENVYDFSLGNPNVPAPEGVKRSVIDALTHEAPLFLHGYNTSNCGYEDVRHAVAMRLNERFHTDYDTKNITMCVGAAGGLNVILKSILDPGDEVITFSPYFGEYRSYVDNYDGVLVACPAAAPSFLPKGEELAAYVTPKTKALIINSPNNPTGVVYGEEVLQDIAAVLKEKEKEYHTSIYLISDEPYREIVYRDVAVPWVPDFYDNTIVCYSYSKSLSLPGERIGYIVLPDRVSDFGQLQAAINVATRILGFVNAPTLQQRIVKACLYETSDVGFYEKNKDILTGLLKDAGFTFVEPQGAFYLFLKSPIEDERIFVEEAKKERILCVGGSSFGCPGYVRLSYCVSRDTIMNCLPAFQRLGAKYFPDKIKERQ